ncbi:MAG: hypothetical protein BroJett042_02530 [Bacteroidota bacterium]|nr:MAG: hypothetical protein BroJett042_02530 [Bacteroidota bacterium]
MKGWIWVLYLFLIGCNSDYETTYYENGSIKSRAKKKNGVYDGDFVIFYSNGNVKAKGYWRNGIGNGYIERYYANGNIKERTNFRNNEFHGKSELHHSNGRIKLLAEYKNGCKINDYKVYSLNGKLIDRLIYNQRCELVYLVKFDSLGKKIEELIFPEFRIVEESPISLNVKLRFNLLGSREIKLGVRDSDYFQSISEVFHVTDTSEHTLNIPDGISLDRLYYNFTFEPQIGDSIAPFEFDKRVFTMRRIKQQTNDIAERDERE